MLEKRRRKGKNWEEDVRFRHPVSQDLPGYYPF